MGKAFLLISILFLFFSCSKVEKRIEETPIVNFKVELDQYLKVHYKKSIPPTFELAKLDSINWIDSFYKTNNYTAIWINDSIDLSHQGKSLLDSFSKAEHYGLTPVAYQTAMLLKLSRQLSKIEEKPERYLIASKLEALLTNSYFLFGKHLHYGVLDSIDSITVLPRKKFRIDMPAYLKKATKKDSLLEKLFELQPKIEQYKKIAEGLS